MKSEIILINVSKSYIIEKLNINFYALTLNSVIKTSKRFESTFSVSDKTFYLFTKRDAFINIIFVLKAMIKPKDEKKKTWN